MAIAKLRRMAPVMLSVALLGGCAGFQRGCSSNMAGAFGSSWLVVQYRADGSAMNCWKLKDASVANEEKSDGIYWQDPKSRHLVHVSGWYNRVQVDGADFEVAAQLVGVDAAKCGNGKYPIAGVASR